MGEKLRRLYREASEKAIDNSVDLYHEASRLHEDGHYPRAFTLCIFSLEEFTKAFMYRCISVGILEERGVQKVIGHHPIKIQTSAHLIRWAIYLLDYLDKIQKSIEKDKQHKDHGKHTYPEVNTKALFESAEEAIATLFGREMARNNSIYVDVVEGKIIEPKNFLEEERCTKAIVNTKKVLTAHTKMVLESDEFFTKTVNDFLYLLIRDIKLEIKKRMKKMR